MLYMKRLNDEPIGRGIGEPLYNTHPVFPGDYIQYHSTKFYVHRMEHSAVEVPLGVKGSEEHLRTYAIVSEA